MTSPVDQAAWLAARADLLAAEKEHTRAQDRLAEQRRSLPTLRIDSTYRFDTVEGDKTLAELFAGRPQLIVQHFMFGTDWDEGCPSCSFWADSVSGITPHLAARGTTFVASSNAPLETLLAYRDRMGWTFDWVSAKDSDFNADMGFSANHDRPAPLAPADGEGPGVSVFAMVDGDVLLTYQTQARGLEPFNAAYNLLDMTALGRHEDELPWTMAWVQRRDTYDV